MKTFKKYLTEKLKKTKDESVDTTKYLKHTNTISNAEIGQLYDDIHDHPDITPQNLSDEHKSAIGTYSFDSGKMNNYLDSSDIDHDKKIHEQINRTASIFTRENTNRKPIITYSGIPTDTGKKLMGFDYGTKHTITRFTSTSTSPLKALNFAKIHAKNPEKELHLLQLYNDPGASVSIAKHSQIPDEDEVLLNHGAHVTYLYTTKHKHPNNSTTIFIHHVKTHNTHTPLEEYKNIKK